MPALQLERQMCDWLEESHEEVDLTSHMYAPGVAVISLLGSQGETYPKLLLRFRCPAYDVDAMQDIWDLAYAVRVKVAREDMQKYESERRLLENLNDVYGDEMEQEEREFLQRGKDYHRRRLSPG